MNEQLPDAGWYDNPEGEGERYWDGHQWTDQYRGKQWNPQVRIDELAEGLTTRLGVRKELKNLASYLNEGEHVVHMTSGSYNGKAGLVVATDRRVLFLSAGMLGSQFEDIPYSKISSVQQSSGLMLASMVVHASGTKAEIGNLNKDHAKALAEYVRSQTSDAAPEPAEPQAQPAQAPQASAGTVDPVEQVRKLGELRDEGLLSEEEFEAKKKQILGL